jgi:AI-2 transport protein TqsA
MSVEKKETGDLMQIKIFVGFIAVVIVVIILQQLKNIFLPLFMALLLYFLFNGTVKKLVKLRVPKSLVLILLVFIIFVLFYFFGALIYASVSSFIEKFPSYTGKIEETLKGIFEKLSIPVSQFNDYIEKIDWTKSIDTSSVTSILSSTFGSFTAFIGNLVLVLLFLMFMLSGRGDLMGRVSKAFDEDDADTIKDVFDSIEDQVRHYLLIKTSMCLLTGVVCGLVLFIGGFDFVLLSALLIFVLNFIPTFGSVMAAIIPVLLGFLKFGFSVRVFLVLAGLMISQFVIGNIIEPKITGKSLNISPIVILVSLIFWGYIWGIVGMMLAVPMTAALKIFFEQVPVLNPLANLISAE